MGVEEDSCPEVEEEETVTAEAVAICAASATLWIDTMHVGALLVVGTSIRFGFLGL